MANNAGEVHSFRLPAGKAKELFELTGRKVGTVAREQVLAVIEAAKLEQTRATGSPSSPASEGD
jgi:hypothetical protein